MPVLDPANEFARSLAKVLVDEGHDASADLAAHKVHAAETFATKAGMQEQTARLLRATGGVGNRIDGLIKRLDRFYENQPRRTRS